MSAKLGPISGIKELSVFVQRVKPLYFCTEKEVASYAFLMGFPVRFNECPNANDGFRSIVRDELNRLENVRPGTKKSIVSNFLSLLPQLKNNFAGAGGPQECSRCGNPSARGVCKTCGILEMVSSAN